jgi:hypothetical protein
MSRMKNFLELSKKSAVRKHALQPINITFRNRYWYFFPLEPEAEAAAKRIISIHVIMKQPTWKGVSPRRFFAGGYGRITKREVRVIPLKLPRITNAPINLPGSENIPLLQTILKTFRSQVRGLRFLEKAGLIEIKTINDMHYIMPTKKFLDVLEGSLKRIQEHRAKL